MNFQNYPGLRTNCSRVIGERCFVRRSNLSQLYAGSLEDFADTKSPANLDEFTARDNDFRLGRGKMLNDQHQCGCAVIHDCGRFRAAKQRECGLDITAAVPAGAGREIVLEI